MKNPRRAYDKDGTEFVPLDLGGLRGSGCHNVYIECRKCGREASVNVDALPDETPVPDVAIVWTKLVCSQCGARGEALHIRPDWHDMDAIGMGPKEWRP